jgi:hypothetical protein
MRFVIRDVILDEDEEEFFLVQLIDEVSADDKSAMDDELDPDEWFALVEQYGLIKSKSLGGIERFELMLIVRVKLLFSTLSNSSAFPNPDFRKWLSAFGSLSAEFILNERLERRLLLIA